MNQITSSVFTFVQYTLCRVIKRFLSFWHCFFLEGKATFLTQLLPYIPGVTFLEAGNPLELLHEIGSLTGKMDKALKVIIFIFLIKS